MIWMKTIEDVDSNFLLALLGVDGSDYHMYAGLKQSSLSGPSLSASGLDVKIKQV
jgi:hypothetical protein